jgi:hypothetical protein
MIVSTYAISPGTNRLAQTTASGATSATATAMAAAFQERRPSLGMARGVPRVDSRASMREV